MFVQVTITVDVFSFTAGNAKKNRPVTVYTADVVATTAVVSGLCNFMAGLLVGGTFTWCWRKHWNQQKREQRERPPVYEEVEPNENTAIELQHNKAYGHF